MTNEVIIRCQKTPEVDIRRIPPIHPWNQLKIWGPVPPCPQPKTATAYHKQIF